ncbi:MAG: type IV pili twitching motility protein PilT, partial [Oscillospiraceae bacterium]|nr:type IV pili twitching motility protein PilT [Oscillospiraceae bacterium]
MQHIDEILKAAVDSGVTDVFVIAGSPVAYKNKGVISPQGSDMIMPEAAEVLIRNLYDIAGRDISRLISAGDDDFAFSIAGVSRFRASTYKQRGSLA